MLTIMLTVSCSLYATMHEACTACKTCRVWGSPRRQALHTYWGPSADVASVPLEVLVGERAVEGCADVLLVTVA